MHSYVPSVLTSSICQGKLSNDLRPSYWEKNSLAGLTAFTDILDNLVKPYLHSRYKTNSGYTMKNNAVSSVLQNQHHHSPDTELSLKHLGMCSTKVSQYLGTQLYLPI